MINITHTKEEAMAQVPDWVDADEYLHAAKELFFADANSSAPSWNDLSEDEQMEYHVRVVRALDPDYRAPTAAGALATYKEDPDELREPLVVTCSVTIPASSPRAAAAALSLVPENSGVRVAPSQEHLIVTWREER